MLYVAELVMTGVKAAKEADGLTSCSEMVLHLWCIKEGSVWI